MYHKKSLESVVHKLKSSFDGISNKEAKIRLNKFGYNEFIYVNEDNKIENIIKSFKDPIIIMLVILSITQVIIGEYINGSIIGCIIVLNTMLYIKKDKKLINNKKIILDTNNVKNKVLRDNKIISITSKELVVGDVVILDTGDYIMTDGRILSCEDMYVSQSVLTGDIEAVKKNQNKIKKDVDVFKQINMVFSGSQVVNGSGKYIVTAIGDETEVGRKLILTDDKHYIEDEFKERLKQFNKVIALNA